MLLKVDIDCDALLECVLKKAVAFLGLVVLSCFFMGAAVARSKAAEVTALRLGRSASQPQIVLAFTKKPRIQVFTLSNPARLIVDLSNTRLRVNVKRLKTFKQIHQIRSGIRHGHDVRLVFELDKLPKQVEQVWLRARGKAPLRLLLRLIQTEHNAVSKKKSAHVDLPVYLKKVRVVIDPGHGGRDPGATSRQGVHEKEVTLAIARALQDSLNKKPGVEALLTRQGDYYVGLRQRLRIARRQRANLFISIHADAFRNRSARGASVYALSERGASSEAARWIAEKENRSELIGGVELNDKSRVLRSLLLDLSQTATVNSSLVIGQRLLNALDDVTRLHKSDVEQAGFVVLKSPDIPSLLIETGFLSNRAEAKKLASRSYQRRLASTLAEAVWQYYSYRAPLGTWFAWHRDGGHYHVERGDNLSSLAVKFAVPMRRLMKANRLVSTHLRIGQQLYIPPG